MSYSNYRCGVLWILTSGLSTIRAETQRLLSSFLSNFSTIKGWICWKAFYFSERLYYFFSGNLITITASAVYSLIHSIHHHWAFEPFSSVYPARPASKAGDTQMSHRHFMNCMSSPPGGEWRIKYNRAIREMEFTKKKLHQEFDEKLDTEQQSKRHLERRARNSV